MALVAFAAPPLARYHLHERLARELREQDMEVRTLCLDAPSHTFARCQGDEAALLPESAPDPMNAPIGEFAEHERRRHGLAAGGARGARWQRRTAARLSRLLPSAMRWMEANRPDVVLLHQTRSAEHLLLQFAARETGARVLWTGDGLLPHTLQVDERGLDGEASSLHRRAADYRVVASDPLLLEACLAHTLARVSPSALSRREVVAPPPGSRLRDCLRAVTRSDWLQAGRALTAWRAALPPSHSAARDGAHATALPGVPFVALLLQDPREERVRLDAPDAPPHRVLVRLAAAAARHVDPGLRLAVLAPSPRALAGQLTGLPTAVPVDVVPTAALPEVAATALATITVNHPLATISLLAGTPVVHLGRALFGVPGVATPATDGDLGPALARALHRNHPALRERFLSWLFRHAHVWCSSTLPDHNGLAGFAQAVARRLPGASPESRSGRYRPGPAWPLATEKPGP
jgi:hypothetical protein